MLTLKAINRNIHEIDPHLNLRSTTEGYLYFIYEDDDTLDSQCTYLWNPNQLTLDEWLCAAAHALTKYKK